MLNNDFYFYLARYLDLYPFLLPLGLIGFWRWSVWIAKKTTGLFYKAKRPGFETSVSVVTPVYNEDPDTFSRAIESWKRNKPDEIIAVIDHTDKNCISIFKDFAKKTPGTKLIITKTPGKREALADGIRASKSEIMALVDSDTIWAGDTLKNALGPFNDRKIGGVATRQSVEKPKTIAQKLFSIRLEQRYWDDIPFLAASGDVLVCLSGRTAFYRSKALMPILDRMVGEVFMGEKVISGEDKRLTYLIEAEGWKTTYQSNSQVYTTGVRDILTFLKQQVRWTRNSWRNDLRALFIEPWVLRHRIFTIYLIDRAIQPFTLLISPIYFSVALVLGLWIPVGVIFVWWHISRLVKMYPHLRKHPADIWMLPIFIVFTFVSAYIRIYSLFSVNVQGWITRWDESRLPQRKLYSLARGHMFSIILIGVVASGVIYNKFTNFLLPRENQASLVARTLPTSSTLALSNKSDVLGVAAADPQTKLTKGHIFQETDSLAGVAAQYGVNVYNLLYANVSKITNWNRMKPGTLLTVPPHDLNLTPSYQFNYQRIYDDYLRIYYVPDVNQIVVEGRGYGTNLSQISALLGSELLQETEPKVWLLRANILLRSGTTLFLDKDEVKWLKMASSNKGYVSIRGSNADVIINGVKITSWDETAADYDKNLEDGRSYLLVKDNARMDVTDSEIAYLGFARSKDLPYSSYGISWRMSTGKLGIYLLTGEIINSKFHDNYFGAYTYGATGMTWRDNEFYNNVRYGLDPHDDSTGFLVENNKFYSNGTHGLILSKRCTDFTIRNNQSYNNKLHGIMLHELSNNNLIVNNNIYANHDGISIDNSGKNTISNNMINKNRRGILADKKSKENVITKNEIKENSQYGIYLNEEASDNVIDNNKLSFNQVGMYVKTAKNQATNNKLEQNEVGIYFSGKADGNMLDSNSIIYNTRHGIYAKIQSGLTNLRSNSNYFLKNHKSDVAAFELK